MELSKLVLSDDDSVNGVSHTDILEEVEELPLDEEEADQLSTVVELPEEEVEADLVEETAPDTLQTTPEIECVVESAGQKEEVEDRECSDDVETASAQVQKDGHVEAVSAQVHEDCGVQGDPVSTQAASVVVESHGSAVVVDHGDEVTSADRAGEGETGSANLDLPTQAESQKENLDSTANLQELELGSENSPESGNGQIEVTANGTSADNKSQCEIQMSDITNQPSTPAQTNEELPKKKRKKKKNKAGKEELSRAHIQGGFSSGWVGPMLQLVTSMKRIDDFKLCYSKQFGPKGYGYGQGAGALQMNSLSLDPTVDGVLPNKPTTMSEALIQAPPGQGCPRCGGAVFEAEKMQSRFRNYHRKCFNCKECNSTLDSTKACDGPDKDVYCKLCYSKKYGPKGYGFGCGAAFLQSDAIRDEAVDGKSSWSPASTTSIKAAPGQGCPRCGGAVFAAELMLSKGKEWHRSCFTCRDCKRPLDSTIACDGPDHEVYCKQDYARRFGLKGFGFGHAPTLVSGSVEEQLPNNGMVLQPSMGAKAPPGEGCPRCGFFVYAAEKMPVKNRTYHRKCFNCNKCHKSLDSTNACDSPDEEIYCRTCYGRLFGPKGVGYGLGAGVLSMG